MKRTALIFCLLTQPLITGFADDIVKIDGTVITGTVTAAKPQGIMVRTEDGLVLVPFSSLPEETRIQFGYDPAAEKAALQKDAADQLAFAASVEAFHANENQKKADAEADYKMYEPFSSLANSMKPYRELDSRQTRELLETLKNLFSPYYKNGTATREDIANWCGGIANRQIMVGMPAAAVKLAWGKPYRITENSQGPTEWVYQSENSNWNYVYIEEGIVSSWQTSR